MPFQTCFIYYLKFCNATTIYSPQWWLPVATLVYWCSEDIRSHFAGYPTSNCIRFKVFKEIMTPWVKEKALFVFNVYALFLRLNWTCKIFNGPQPNTPNDFHSNWDLWVHFQPLKGGKPGGLHFEPLPFEHIVWVKHEYTKISSSLLMGHK